MSLVRTVDQQSKTLSRLRSGVERLRRSDSGLEQQRADIEIFIQQLDATRAQLAPLLATAEQQILELGPKPAADGPVEAPEVARERGRLAAAKAQLIGAQKRLALTKVRAGQLIERIQDYRLRNFADNILERSKSPLSMSLWRDVRRSLPRLATQLATIADSWWVTAKLNIALLPLRWCWRFCSTCF